MIDFGYHNPVMLQKCMEALNLRKGCTFVDATLGGCGHSVTILRRLAELGGGRLVSIDQDNDAVEHAEAVVKGDELAFSAIQSGLIRFDIVKNNFGNLADILSDLNIDHTDGVLMDLGISSHQVDAGEKGFSFRFSAPLDMRMDQNGAVTAADLVADLSEAELCRIFRDYGEEQFAFKIARSIVSRRSEEPITDTVQLAELISECIPKKFHFKSGGKKSVHPATKCFQALRIAVNDEMTVLEEGLRAAINSLAPQGRLAVMTYHSLEDRIVKRAVKECLGRCTCPPSLPVCVCGAAAVLKEISKHPILPDPEEIEANPRSRSAKLRIAEKC